MSEINVDYFAVQQAVVLGLARFNAEDEVYELTDKGDKWLREWIDEKLAEHANQPKDGD